MHCLHSSDLLAFISQYAEQTINELLYMFMHVDVRYRIQELNLENGILKKNKELGMTLVHPSISLASNKLHVALPSHENYKRFMQN